MKRIMLVGVVILLAIGQVIAQELYMPRNVRGAYAAGFRSMDGKPGPKYFLNKSVHSIKIRIIPPSPRITGEQEIIYTNNSPMPLAAIYLRYDINVRAPEAMRERPVDPQTLTGPVVIDEFSEDGVVTPYKSLAPFKGQTLDAIQLLKPIQPGGSRKLSFKWHYDLGKHSGGDREGIVDPTTYYVAYFYPRIAVFEAANSWDAAFHMGSHEFFGEFNDYTLEVTVPKNFVVWSTGELQNADAVLQPKYAERLKRSYTGDEIIRVATEAEMRAGGVTAQDPMNTWLWTAKNVPDVTFGLSDHYNWDASSVVVDKKTGRRASAQAAYDTASTNFANMVKYIREALDFASNDYPGVPYPYPKMTIFRGFADMEAPMMANDSSQTKDLQVGGVTVTAPEMQQYVATHEILHTYFPFFMGINERRYSFMEEGWTTAFEYPFNVKLIGKERADAMYKDRRVSTWNRLAGTNPGADIPIMTPEDSMTGDVYATNKYGRAAIGYLALRDMLGETEFKRALHVFMDRWNGKHPLPWDMFFSFNNATGRNLNWFWKSVFFDNSYIDLAIGEVKTDSTGTSVVLNNFGGWPAPTDLVVTFNDGTAERIHQGPQTWENSTTATVRITQTKAVKSVTLDNGIYLDSNPTDNVWPKPGR